MASFYQWDRRFETDSQVQLKLLQEGMAPGMVYTVNTPDTDLRRMGHHPRKWSVFANSCLFVFFFVPKIHILWLSMCLNFLFLWRRLLYSLFLCRNTIQKGPVVHHGTEVLQRDPSFQAAGQAPLVSQARTGQAGWFPAAAACQQPKDFNQGLSPKQLLSPALLPPQEAAATTPFEASNSSQLAPERGNKTGAGFKTTW